MAKRKRTAPSRGSRRANIAGAPLAPAQSGPQVLGSESGAETTGRFIVIFKDDAVTQKSVVSNTLHRAAGLRRMTVSADFGEREGAAEALASSDPVHFEKLGIVVVTDQDAVASLASTAASEDSPILAIEPEYIAYPSIAQETSLPLEYLRGYRDAVNQLYDQLANRGIEPGVEADIAATFQDTPQFTWGLQATRVSTSSRSGQGIRVAVLDTGLDFQHPDFRGRAIQKNSFVPGVTPDDVAGHGTHCIGTSCGAARPASGVRRYGVAFNAQIFVGKVFNNAPRPQAPTGSVVAGIEWAMTNDCRVASLSLGVPINQKIMQYETPIRRALRAGTLVVCAAGNNAQRPANLGFVEPPANADASMAVAAVDSQLRIAAFSARSSQLTGIGGIVNIAAPGVSVFSSVPIAQGGHAPFNGTSMATPHVAGIAALWSQATGETGQALWNRLAQTARPLSLPSLDVGVGLVQAPP